ncbi:imidazole glycerol phosphate synthase subunit HisH [Roseateles oligotrophus]|uniref:Imidazole glycerol phosphate synthase subunit HisH n=1 Tax=Roseateles oligotrophus TaxID=1769250 RepID=A0ABT2YE10_9BURK|nr:imidazole glycerol phosphate synthase subunit HisH [Roseateles oligotrophus]MCV2368259.1 imidazole glycerol phosphate synthase subunit HisH [Roseateles oligotrophus]
MISIVSYGSGNINSIANMFRALGQETEFVDCPTGVLAARKLVLPGVGSFDYGMTQLQAAGLTGALAEAALKNRVPILGICLGMQLMCCRSEEGNRLGLGWVDADVRKFQIPSDQPNLKVPHMGWNTIKLTREDRVVSLDDVRQRYYFVHSYYVHCREPNDIVATSNHGHEFVAAFSHGNLYGVQFHPEKSHRYGMALMKRFGDL